MGLPFVHGSGAVGEEVRITSVTLRSAPPPRGAMATLMERFGKLMLQLKGVIKADSGQDVKS